MTGSHIKYRNNNARVKIAVDEAIQEVGMDFHIRDLTSRIKKVRGREVDPLNAVHFLHERIDIVYRGHGMWRKTA